ncbi:hypothetical protein EW146_g855 [Bondarzewia mesenterica]|uniref:Uncharacterized protein n=1 Tax=Bondarzewia mesenterica TaxID=1095465 RepID=A0A4S4M5M6_9AGAM|nr:hypothetical protein EW146_g855 [Bondarzewia mesenterica]
MFLSSPSLPSHSSTWSIIRSLSTLSPPPSDISLTQLSTLRSTGEIPIFLHRGIRACLSSVSSNFENSGDLSLNLGGDSKVTEKREHPNIVGGGGILPSHSFGTACTYGTFGPLTSKNEGATCKTGLDIDSAWAALGLSDQEDAFSYTQAMGIPLLSFDAPGEDLEQDDAAVPTVSLPDPFQVEQRAVSRSSSVHQIPLDSGRVSLRSPVDEGGQMLLMTPSQSFSTLATPVFAPPSPSYSLDTPESSPSRALRSRLRYAVNKGINYVASRNSQTLSPSSRPTSPAAVHNTLDSRSGSPVRKNHSPKPKSHNRSRSRGGSTSTTNSVQSSRSAQSSPALIPAAPSSSEDLIKFPYLPLTLSWLKDTIIDLFIDQEGFRAIHPTFKLAGYSPPPESDTMPMSLNLHLRSAQADFMPLKRRSFIFHHATLDTPPTLRRLTINGDESHDYISRQAYLSLKFNGAYSVHGSESSYFDQQDGTSEHMTLLWKFDYVVGDRRTDTGKLVPGEKTFTPLSFSCSPGLLHAAHRKKIRFMHIVKKSVAPKLMAEKLEPPAPPRPHTNSPSLSPKSPPADTYPPPHVTKTGFLTSHRRTRSQACNHPSDTTAPDLLKSWEHALQSVSLHPTFHLTSSRPKSAEYTSHQVSLPLPVSGFNAACGSDVCPPPLPLHSDGRFVEVTMDKHILPASVLASMLSNHSESDSAVRANVIVPLSPPKHAVRSKHSVLQK